MRKNAIHEAGHCIVGLAFSYNIDRVSISGTTEGSVIWSFPGHAKWSWSIPHARRALSVDVAGYVAEANPVSKVVKALARWPGARMRYFPGDIFQVVFRASAICFGSQPRIGLAIAAANCCGLSGNIGLEITECVLAEIDRAERRAERILKSRLTELEMLASALQQRKHLNGNQIAAILKHTGHPV